MDFDQSQLFSFLLKTCVAFIFSLPIAWNREQSARGMGLRTFPLVAVASCGYVLLSLSVVGTNEAAQGRIIQGLMTGMGFIGGGAILKKENNIHGTAMAASIWTTGVVGASVAYGHYELAIIISLINFLALMLLTPVKNHIRQVNHD